jgi:transposase InsO family protein
VPFELIHSDLKSFEVESYHKYKYAIVYYDDFTSMAWVVCLRLKDQAFTATKQFVSYVRTQYNALIKGWRSDAGSKFTSKAFRDYLKDNGIHIHQSAPYAHQQNGRAE